MTAPAARLHGVSINYGPLVAVREASVDIRAGEILGISGANGAGMSTLLGALAGLGQVTAGERQWRLRGADMHGAVSARRMVRSGVALVPEGRGLFKGLSVIDNLRVGAVAAKRRDVAAGLDRAFTIFPKLAQRRMQDVASLSGGEQQMVAIGRALMAEPELLLVDELSLGLAPVVANDVYDALLELNESRGTTLVLVDESLARLNRYVGRLFVMRHGRLSEEIAQDQREAGVEALYQEPED